MKTARPFVTILAIFLTLVQTVFGQDPVVPPVYRIQTLDGTILVGTIISETETEIVFKTETIGVVSIAINNIEKKELKDDFDKKLELSNPNRYFVMNNYIGLPKGKGYYQNTWILFNQVNYGLSDYFSVGGGLVPTFLFGGPTPMWIVPSISFPVVKDNFSLGGSFVFIFVPGERGSAGFFTFGGTIGNRHNNLSFNLGYGFSGGQWAESPLVSVSGMVRTGRRHHLLAENYFVNVWVETYIISLLGGRYNFGPISLDYGLILPWELTGGFGVVAFPWLGLSIPIGK